MGYWKDVWACTRIGMSEKQAENLIAHLRYGNLTEKQKEEEINKAIVILEKAKKEKTKSQVWPFLVKITIISKKLIKVLKMMKKKTF